MKTAVWLYLFLFVAFFDLHAQYPMLTPYAVSLGAAPSFIGLVMGMYSLTHLPGNLMAGYGVDRFGSRYFISISLIGAGILLLLQARVQNPWELLYIRSVSGFVLAFLSPACMSLLAKLARDHIHQGKLMAGNGLVHTIASVVSPAAGAWLAATIGFSRSFAVLGWVLLATGILSIMFIREPGKQHMNSDGTVQTKAHHPSEAADAAHAASAVPAAGKFPWIVLILPISLSCAQGILSFELPISARTSEEVMAAGLLFSVVSLGALITLAMMFLNRYLPYARTIAGLAMLAGSYYALASGWPVSIVVVLLVIGMAKGVLFPAMTSFLLQLTGTGKYGRTFSWLSIALSVGSFIGPVAAGAMRDQISPYFISFAALMIALLLLYPRRTFQDGWDSRPIAPPA